MSIYFSGSFKRSGGVVSAIRKQLQNINLKAVHRITFTFDPFGENVTSTREVLTYLSSSKIIATNPKCLVKTDVACNRKPAEIKFALIPEAQEQIKSKDIRFLSENLTSLEILQLCNKHISVLAPKEDLKPIIQTKSAKKAQGLSKSGRKR